MGACAKVSIRDMIGYLAADCKQSDRLISERKVIHMQLAKGTGLWFEQYAPRFEVCSRTGKIVAC